MLIESHAFCAINLRASWCVNTDSSAIIFMGEALHNAGKKSSWYLCIGCSQNSIVYFDRFVNTPNASSDDQP